MLQKNSKRSLSLTYPLLVKGIFFFLSIGLGAQIADTALVRSDLSSDRNADASINNLDDRHIVEDFVSRSITAISGTAETDFNTPQTFGRPNTDATTADAKIYNEGDLFVSTIDYAFSSGVKTQARASIRVTSSNGETNSKADAIGSITNQGQIHLINGGQGLDTKIDVDSTAFTTASAPSPARSFAVANGDGSIRNLSEIRISNRNLSISHGIKTDVMAEGSAIGMVFWRIPPSELPDDPVVTIETEAKAKANGSVQNDGNLSLDVTGFGSSYGIQTQAEAISAGVSAFSHADAGVMNRGDISVSISDAFFAFGIHTEAKSESKARENGELSGLALASVQNHGNVDVQASNSTGAYGISTRATLVANARGAAIKELKADHSVSNYGSIRVLSSGSADAYGIYSSHSIPNGYETEVSSTVYNRGFIRVESSENAHAPASGNATGIYFKNGGTLHSAGLIKAFSESGAAYQVVSEKDLTITAYSIDFGPGTESEFQGVIQSAEPVHFEDAILYASLSDDLVSGTYAIPDLVEGEWQQSEDASSKEQFTSVFNQIDAPDFQVQLLPANPGSGQRIDIRYAPSASIANKSTRLSGDLIQQASSRSQRRLLSSVIQTKAPPESQQNEPSANRKNVFSRGQLYGSPIYSNSQIDSEPLGYRADTYGFELGYYRQLTNRLNLGLIGGYNESSVDFTGTGFDGRTQDQKLYYGGLNGTHLISDQLSLLGTLLYYETSNKYEDHLPSNIEDADYRGRGLDAALSLAYSFRLPNTSHSLTPRLGVSYLLQKRESFVTENKVGFDTSYDGISEDHFYSHLGVDWLSDYNINNWRITPHVALEVRRVLGDEDLIHLMSVGNSSATVSDTRDSWQYEGSGSIRLARDNLGITAGIALYKIENDSSYGLWLRMDYSF